MDKVARTQYGVPVSLPVCMGVAAVLHATFVLFIVFFEKRDWKVPRIVNYTAWTIQDDGGAGDARCGDDGVVCTVEPASIVEPGTLSLRWLSIGFHLVSFFFQALCLVLMRTTQGLYIRDILDGVNLFRWVEYAISAPMMIVLVSTLAGTFDYNIHVALVALTIATMMCGAASELVSSVENAIKPLYSDKVVKRTVIRRLQAALWVGHAAGWLCQLGTWWVVFKLLLVTLDNSLTQAPDDIRAFIIAINVVIGIFFVSFGICQLVSLLAKRRVVAVELTYVALSLSSKLILGLLLTFGVVSRDGLVDAQS